MGKWTWSQTILPKNHSQEIQKGDNNPSKMNMCMPSVNNAKRQLITLLTWTKMVTFLYYFAKICFASTTTPHPLSSSTPTSKGLQVIWTKGSMRGLPPPHLQPHMPTKNPPKKCKTWTMSVAWFQHGNYRSSIKWCPKNTYLSTFQSWLHSTYNIQTISQIDKT